ncbi:MAG: FadR/GntR family transcriptional regulator [Steroidobacteraceae bacterium]
MARVITPCPVSRFSLLSPERGKSSHDQIAAVLGSELLQGLYPPDGLMPAEAALRERFHVSRTVLREVMKTLAAKGLVSPKTRVGTRVRDAVYWNYFDSDVLAWRLGRRRPQDSVLLRECLLRIRRKNHTRQSFSEADLDFHPVICRRRSQQQF